MNAPTYPSLYQINTRVWMTELARSLGRPATLEDVPDDHPSPCYVRLPFPDLGGRRWRLRDLLGEAQYQYDGSDLQSRGLYLDVPSWQCHVFEITPV